MDGVEEGAAVMQENIGVRALQEGAEVVDVDFEEVQEGFDVGSVCGQLEQMRGDWVGHVVLEGVRGQFRAETQVFSDVATSFGCGTEECRAGGPAHLEGCGDNEHDVIEACRWVG